MHQLVAAYLGYEPDRQNAEPAACRAAESPDAVDAQAFAQMAGLGSIPASDALRAATHPMEALDAMAAMVFGPLMEF